MSIFSSLYIGMSGMRTHERAIGVIGNNIANVNTVGFKASRAVFADLLSANVMGTAGLSQEGQGAALAAVQRLVTQGAFLGTNVTTDLAIAGDGYFVVQDAQGGRAYTRNGQLQTDKEGFLTTIDNLRLQGYVANTDGTFATGLSSLNIGDATAPPNATTSIDMIANLDRDAPIQTFDVNDPANTSSHTTQVTVYDSLGRPHQADVYFTQTAAGQWEWNAVVPQNDLDGSGNTTPTIIASGTMTFDTDGLMTAQNQTQSAVTFNGATAQNLAFDFGDLGDPNGTTSFVADSAVSFVDQDGYGAGQLSFISIDTDGTIKGTFSNGEERAIARLALARFTAPEQLHADGNNLFTETLASGEPAIGTAGTGGRGEILAGALEQSTVDLTNEFTSLILAQRGFQANARTITTADEMLVEAVNLKR